MTNYQGDDVLDTMSKYAPNRNKSIEKLLRKHVIEKLPANAQVLEFGAGKGEFILRFTKDNIQISAVEIDESYIKKLSEQVLVFNSIDEVPDGLDVIYLIDVLEHIKNESSLLEKFYCKLNQGGKMFIYVPARQELYSEFDKKIGHFRRYSIKTLCEVVTRGGFKIRTCHYHELLGYAASGLNKFFNNKSGLNPKAVKLYDAILVPITNLFERLFSPPVGKSIYLVAEKR